MHPGSGPSDRDNDVLFPPIRDHLLAHGVAVCSFDKRGVEAVVAALAHDGDGPVGLFGHSQGGWVVVEVAGRRAPIEFAIANSGPGVSPAVQNRFFARNRLERKDAIRCVDAVLGWISAGVPFGELRERLAAAGLSDAYECLESVGLAVPDEAEWKLECAMIDYDPRPALERTEVPLLAIFGEQDRVVPVADSVKVFEAAVRPDLLTVAIFPGADHRLGVGDPPRFADGYLNALTSFIAGARAA